MKKVIKLFRSLFKRHTVKISGRVYHVDTSQFKDGDLLYVGQHGKLTNKKPEFNKADLIATGKHETVKGEEAGCIIGVFSYKDAENVMRTKATLSGKIIDVDDLAIGIPNYEIMTDELIERNDKYIVMEEIKAGDLIKIINGKIYKV